MNKELTFEEKKQKLEGIISQLQNMETPLEDTIKLYEEGLELCNDCSKLLNLKEQKINTITSSEVKEDE